MSCKYCIAPQLLAPVKQKQKDAEQTPNELLAFIKVAYQEVLSFAHTCCCSSVLLSSGNLLGSNVSHDEMNYLKSHTVFTGEDLMDPKIQFLLSKKST